LFVQALLLLATAQASKAIPAWPSDAVITNERRVCIQQREVTFVRRCDLDGEPVVTFSFSFPALEGSTASERAVNTSMKHHLLSDSNLTDFCVKHVSRSQAVEGNEVSQNCQTSRITSDLFSVRCHYSAGYSADGHYGRSFGTIWFLNYDLHTGRELKLQDVVVDLPRFKSLLRDEVRQRFPADHAEPVDEDFLSEAVEASMNSFGFTPDGMDFSLVQGNQTYDMSLPYGALGGVIGPRFFAP
jgi:hypothetical protein